MSIQPLFLWSWLLWAPQAVAASDAETPTSVDQDAEARQLYANGAALYDEGLYEQAIEAFRASYALSKRHAMLLNIANAQERLGELSEAVDTLNDYRVYADAETQLTLGRRIRVLEARLEEREAAAAPVEEATPPPALSPPESPPPEPVAPAPQRRSLKWVTLGTGAVTGVGAGVVTFASYNHGRTALAEGEEAVYNRNRSINQVAGVLSGVGGALVVVGVALPGARSVSLSPSLGGLRLGGAF